VLVTEYSPGAGIGWHKDRPEFEHVIGVSLLSPCLFRLRRKRGNGWERASIELQPRSAYLLSGSARTDWQHSIPPVDKLRYSVTFRSFRRWTRKTETSVWLGVPPRLIASLFAFVSLVLGCGLTNYSETIGFAWPADLTLQSPLSWVLPSRWLHLFGRV